MATRTAKTTEVRTAKLVKAEIKGLETTAKEYAKLKVELKAFLKARNSLSKQLEKIVVAGATHRSLVGALDRIQANLAKHGDVLETQTKNLKEKTKATNAELKALEKAKKEKPKAAPKKAKAKKVEGEAAAV